MAKKQQVPDAPKSHPMPGAMKSPHGNPGKHTGHPPKSPQY